MTNLLLVSGASRGLGRAIALSFARSPSFKSLKAVLLARSSEGLAETKSQMEALRSSISVRVHSVDLSDLESLEMNLRPIFPPEPRVSHKEYERTVLINCAGTTGYIGQSPSLFEIQRATNLNFISKTWMSTHFAKTFGETTNCTIVNVSSMCAVKATPTMALYCATSAGRDIYHTVLALNEAPCAKVINYAPGSCDTDMQAMLRSNTSLNPDVQAYCKQLVTSESLVECSDSADELVRRVAEQDFVSGERIEYVNMSKYNY